ncbi:MAG: sulfotransferase domain-containing protein [bacterium]|nr:sulfotransferase domain-containing protein [bacterium]
MPDFLIIGASKCGTTSLYAYLCQHPWIIPALKKETNFFDCSYKRGIGWYRAFFPTVFRKWYVKHRRFHKEVMTGEATPLYLFHPHVPQRVLTTIPKVKLIVLLRNPVDRAYSAYQMKFRRGVETLSFEQAIEKEQERLQSELEKVLDNEHYFSFNRQHYAYLARGVYVEQFKNWMKYFPREQMLILKSENFFSNPAGNFKQVNDFLKLPDWELKEYRRYHHIPYPKMETTTRDRLLEYFAPYNQQLYELLEVDFDWEV